MSTHCDVMAIWIRYVDVHGFLMRLTMIKMKSIVQSTQNLNANHNTWIVDNNCLLKEIETIVSQGPSTTLKLVVALLTI